MRLQITQKQITAARILLNELDTFVKQGYGTITKLLILKNNMLPNTIIIKYDKVFVMNGDFEYEYPIAAITQDGQTEFIGTKFKDIFERSAFLSECQPLDLDNPNDYYLID